jgi:hypothetical protein
MNQQCLNIDATQTFLARLFATVLSPFFGQLIDEVSIREMDAAMINANIDPIFATDIEVTVNEECSTGSFEVSVGFKHGGSQERAVIYVTEADLGLGEVDALEEFAAAIELHGARLSALMDKARSCPADQRMVSLAHTNLQQAFFWLREAHKEPKHGY